MCHLHPKSPAPAMTALTRQGAAIIALLVLSACGGDSLDISDPTAPSTSSHSLLEVVSGNAQRGLTGRALADSIVVRARTPSGAPAVGIELSWAASAGALSATTTTTDESGLARVQWIAGSGDGTATVTYPAPAPAIGRGARYRLTITSNGRPSGACQLASQKDSNSLTLGPTDLTVNLAATAPHHAVVLFMDFSDAPATETTDSLMNLVVRPGLALLNELSYGRIQLQVTAVPRWYRFPKPRETVQAGHVGQAMRLADPDVDFSRYDAVYLFMPVSPTQPISYSFDDGGIDFDGVKAGKNGAKFGRDARTYGASVFAHETGHIFGLPDLYRYDAGWGPTYRVDPIRDVGPWSLMSHAYLPGHFLAWEKRKLGFLEESQVDCLEGPGGEEAVLQPIEVPGGLKMIALRLDDSRALVIEVRSAQGSDVNLCAQGVLIYEVNAAAKGGAGPARVRGSRVTAPGPLYTKCGSWADATYGLGPGEISGFTDASVGISVQVLAAEAGGAYRVRVKR
jgi:M6 family metalloprotease-like protein